MRIQHNILAMNAYRNYTNNTSALSKNLEKLSSGYKINRAGDDAAGLAISEKMRAQITGLGAAQKNVKDGISLVKTAEGALSEVHDMLNRMVSLATQSANGTYDGTDRVQLQKELDQLRTEINRISEASNFNGIKLLDGSMDTSGGIKNVSSVSRMLQQVGTGVANVGRVTILDSDPRIKSAQTEFDIDFTGLTTSKEARNTKPTRELSNVNFTMASVSFNLNVDFGDADEVTLQIGDKYFKLKNTGDLSPAATGTGSIGSPYEISCQGKTKNAVLDEIVSTLNGKATVNGYGFNVSNDNGTLKFVATSAAAIVSKLGGTVDEATKKKFVEQMEANITIAAVNNTPNTPPNDLAVSVVGVQGNAPGTTAGATAAWKIDTGLSGAKAAWAEEGKKLVLDAKLDNDDITIEIEYTSAGNPQYGVTITSRNGSNYKTGDLTGTYDSSTGELTITAKGTGAHKLTGVAFNSSTDITGVKKPSNFGVGAMDPDQTKTGSADGKAKWTYAVDIKDGVEAGFDWSDPTNNLVLSATINDGSTKTLTITITSSDQGDTFNAAVSGASGYTATYEGGKLTIIADAAGEATLTALSVTSATAIEDDTNVEVNGGKTITADKQGAAAAKEAQWDITIDGFTSFKDWNKANEYLTLSAKLDDQDVLIKINCTAQGGANGTYEVTITKADGSPLENSKWTNNCEYDHTAGKLTIKSDDTAEHKLEDVKIHEADITGLVIADPASKLSATSTASAGRDAVRSQGTAGTLTVQFSYSDILNGDTLEINGQKIQITGNVADSGEALASAIRKLNIAGFSVQASYTTQGDIKITLTETADFGGKTEAQLKAMWKYTRGNGSGGGNPGTGSANEVNGVAPANSGIAVATAGAEAKITFGLKLAGQDIIDPTSIKSEATSKEIAAKVWEALKNKYGTATDGSVQIKLNINGANYKITYASGSAKLHFKLTDDTTKDNINGNFDWNITGETSKFGNNHDGGTIVTQAGRAVTANQSANTIFRIEQGDIKEGATITIKDHSGNYKTVTLHVGQDGQDSAAPDNGIGHVYLTSDEAKNLGTVLSRISHAFGSRVGDLEIGVNDRSNGDGHMGLAIKHINTHTGEDTGENVYLTMEEFSKVFELKVPRNPEGTGLSLQIGDTADSYNQLAVSIAACDSAALGLDGVDISTQVGAANAIDTIKAAINYVSDVRGTLGATQNRLEHTQNNLSVMAENIQDAESTIRDTDVAEEMMSYVKNNILIQSAQAMLAQANQIPQGVLQLLG